MFDWGRSIFNLLQSKEMSRAFFAMHFLIDDFIAKYCIGFHLTCDYYYTVDMQQE
jgi:hypothetical protein